MARPILTAGANGCKQRCRASCRHRSRAEPRGGDGRGARRSGTELLNDRRWRSRVDVLGSTRGTRCLVRLVSLWSGVASGPPGEDASAGEHPQSARPAATQASRPEGVEKRPRATRQANRIGRGAAAGARPTPGSIVLCKWRTRGSSPLRSPDRSGSKHESDHPEVVRFLRTAGIRSRQRHVLWVSTAGLAEAAARRCSSPRERDRQARRTVKRDRWCSIGPAAMLTFGVWRTYAMTAGGKKLAAIRRSWAKAESRRVPSLSPASVERLISFASPGRVSREHTAHPNALANDVKFPPSHGRRCTVRGAGRPQHSHLLALLIRVACPTSFGTASDVDPRRTWACCYRRLTGELRECRSCPCRW